MSMSADPRNEQSTSGDTKVREAASWRASLLTVRIATIAIAFFIVLFGSVLAGGGTSELKPLFDIPAFRLPTLVIFLLGWGAGALLGWTFVLHGPRADRASRALSSQASATGIAVGSFALLMIGAAINGALAPARAGLAFLLAVIAALAGAALVNALSRGENFGYESHWGGLGGAGGGWRLLPSTGLGLVALVFASAAVLVVFTEFDSTAPVQAGGNTDATGNAASETPEGGGQPSGTDNSTK